MNIGPPKQTADFELGYRTAQATADLARQLTCSEIKRAGGPDFIGSEDTDETADFHRGYDDAIVDARWRRAWAS